MSSTWSCTQRPAALHATSPASPHPVALGHLAPSCSEEALRRRDQLRQHPAVLLSMGKWWEECKHPTDQLIRLDAYKILYKRLMHQLAPYLNSKKVLHKRQRCADLQSR